MLKLHDLRTRTAQCLRRHHVLESLGQLLSHRKVRGLHHQIAGNLHELRRLRGNLRQGVKRLFALGRESRAHFRNDVVLAHVRVENCLNLALLLSDIRLLLRRIEHDLRLVAVLRQNADSALCVVNLRDQVNQDASDETDSTGLMVHIVIGGVVRFTLPLLNRNASSLIGLLTHLGLILSRDEHHLLCRNLHALHVRIGELRRRLLCRRRDGIAGVVQRVVRQYGEVVSVSRLPIGLKALNGLSGSDIRRLGLQRHVLNRGGRPEVIGTLRVFQCACMALTIQHTINDRFLAHKTDDGDVFTRPVLTVGNLITNDEIPLDLLVDDVPRLDVTLGHKLIENDLGHLRGTYGIAALRQRYQRVLLLDAPVVLSDTDVVFGDPLAASVKRIAGKLVLELRVFLLNDLAWAVLEEEAVTRIRAVELVNVRVEIDAQRVAYPADINLLVKRLIVGVVRDDAAVANASLHLERDGRVVGALGVRDVLDMPNDALKDVCRFLSRTIADRANAHRRLVLATVVDDLQVVLTRLIDRQRGTVVDSSRLAQLIRPLIAIVRVAISELVVLKEIVAGF